MVTRQSPPLEKKETIWLLFYDITYNKPPGLVFAYTREDQAYKGMTLLLEGPLQRTYYTKRESYHVINRLLVAGNLHELPEAWAAATNNTEFFRIVEVEVDSGVAY